MYHIREIWFLVFQTTDFSPWPFLSPPTTNNQQPTTRHRACWQRHLPQEMIGEAEKKSPHSLNIHHMPTTNLPSTMPGTKVQQWVHFILFYFHFWLNRSGDNMGFPGQGSDPSLSCDLSCSCSITRPLTHCIRNSNNEFILDVVPV